MEDIPEPFDLSEEESTLDRTKTYRRKNRSNRAIISTLCCLIFVAVFARLQFVREFVARHPGLLLVFVGVAIEVFFDWKEIHAPLRWLKRIAAVMLVMGLAIEFWESAELDNETSKANERTAELGMQVEGLRSENA